VSDYETIQRKRNIFVGVFVIIGMCALGWLIFKFGDLPTAVTKIGSVRIFVQFPMAPGVQKDTPVRFCGYQIGRVTGVMPPRIRKDLNTNQEYHQTVVILTIDKKYVDIPSNVNIKLMTRGLGSSYIELKVDPESLPAPPRDPNRPETCFLVDGMWLQGSTGISSEFFPEDSQKKLDSLVEDLRTFVNNADDIIGDPNNKENVKRTLANLSEASEAATEAIQQAKQTMEEFKKFATAGTKTLENADAKVDKAIVAMIDTSEQLSKATEQLRLILEKINSGQGTAGMLVNDGRFYESLLENADQMQILLEEMKLFVAKAREKGLPIDLK
jgi:phospholipid/cholesterol/gamma-HCH transport system substrate-binding protein